MGQKSSQAKDKVKQEYLKIIDSKKKDYYKKNEEILNSSDFKVISQQNWKDYMQQEIELIKDKYSRSAWPLDILSLVDHWNTVKDYKWRSNVLWYDYLQSYKVNTAQDPTPVTTISISQVSSQYTNSFEAQSLIEFLHGHFQNPNEHFIAAMIARFNSSFLQEYCLENNELKSNVQVVPKVYSEKMCEDIKGFVMLTLQAMIHYYGGVVAKTIEEKPGEMYDLMLEEVFTNSLQQSLLKVFHLAYKEKCDLYEENLEKYSALTCNDLGIHRYFQLDVEHTKPSKGQGHFGHTAYSEGILNQPRSFKAYGKAVDKLRELENQFSPLKKLGVVIQTSRVLCECVDEYWKDDTTVSKDDLVISADQILSIFLYIVIKAKIPDLSGHVQMICEFGRKIIQNGSMGYYVTTLEACVEQVETMSPELLMKIKEYSLKGY